MRTNKDHRVLALKDFQDKDYEDVLKRPGFCPKPRHEKEELNFFCKNCKTAVCQMCVTLEHAGHTLEHIEDEAERQKTELKNTVQTQRQNLQAKKISVRQLLEHHAKVIQQGEDVKRHVQKFADNLIAVIEARKQNIFAAVENQTKKSLDSLTRKKNKIEDEIKVIKLSLEKADILLTPSTNTEIVQLKKTLDTIFQKADKPEPIARNPEGLPALVFVENQKLSDTVNSEEIGSLEILQQTKASKSIAEGKGLDEAFAGHESQFILTTKNAQGIQCYNKRDRVSVEIQDERGREGAIDVQINDNDNGIYNISYSSRVQGRCSVIVKVNKEHVRGSPFAVLVKASKALSSGNLSQTRRNSSGGHSPSPSASNYVFPKQGACSQSMLAKAFQVKAVSSFGNEGSSVGMFQRPWAVAVNDRDEIAVTDYLNHRVQVFDSGGNYLRSFGRQGSKKGEFSGPAGICFDNNRNIIVADSWNHRIQIFSWEGRWMGIFGGYGSLDSQLSYPCGLSLDSNANIIVADTGNNLIKIFSTYGKFLMKIDGQGSFSCPSHCVGCGGYLIVSDHTEHCMKVLDREGNFQYQFGMQGVGDGEFNSPCCLSVNKSGHLMVCDMDNHRIQVFDLNGTFVGKFGKIGSNLEEFNGPHSVAVLSNGHIVVCDMDNHRIQIFE